MNVMEQLSRETARVAALKVRYDDLRGQERVEVRPTVWMINQTLEQAHEAAGSGDPIKVIAALKGLEGWQE